jgi:hypothetical protein
MDILTPHLFPPCPAEENCTVDPLEKERVAAAKGAMCSSTGSEPCEMTERCVASCAAYGKVCPCVARIAAHAACEAIQELKQDSRLFPSANVSVRDEDAEVCSPEGAQEGDSNGEDTNEVKQSTRTPFPYLKAEDIVIGVKLGEGGFSNVNACKIKDQPDKDYAVKYLKRRAMVDLHQFKHGAADLAVEAQYVIDGCYLVTVVLSVVCGNVTEMVSGMNMRC